MAQGEGTVAEVLAGTARFAVVCGDATAVLATLPDGCAHVTYCDPSYGLASITTADVVACLTAWLAGKPYVHAKPGFMGHTWDAFVPGPEAWREVFRALKPGGYCVAFSSTRTVDLLGIAVRLAGFEQREGWAWVTGQAFPKSLDVSKGIDSRVDWPALDALREKVKRARLALGISQSEAARRVGLIAEGETLGGGGYMWFETGRVPTAEQYAALKSALRLDDECDAAFEAAEREVVGRHRASAGGQNMRAGLGGEGPALPPGDITAAATPAAAQWEGYGTALKPAYEPLIVARRPLAGTVAENVQRHGCGALNIDAGRIASGGPSPSVERRESAARSDWDNRGGGIMNDRTDPARYAAPHAGEQIGRFPASLALVHSEGCERVGVRKVASASRFNGGGPRINGVYGTDARERPAAGYADADGTETVDEWRCVPGCAVAVLGEQSGERQGMPSARLRRGSTTGNGVGYGGGEPQDAGIVGYDDHGTAARFFFNAKASSASRLAFVTCTPGCAAHETVTGSREARSRATCPACGGAREKYEHATVKPLDLARYHARLLSLPAHVDPVALVPFCGTGVEARALLEVGFRVIAVDLDPRHCAMTRHRLAQPRDAPQAKPARKAPRPAAPVAPAAPSPVAEATPLVVVPSRPRGRAESTAQLSLFGTRGPQ